MSATVQEARDYLKDELNSDNFLILANESIESHLKRAQRQIEREYNSINFSNKKAKEAQMMQALFNFNNPINHTLQDRNRGVVSKSYGMVSESYNKDSKNTTLCYEAKELLKEFEALFVFV